MDFKIGKKKFTLDKVSIYISDLYTEYVVASNELLTIDGDFEEIRLSCEVEREEAETKLDKLRAELKMIKAAKELKQEKKQAALDGSKMRNNIIKEIFELNGYEWDDDILKRFDESNFSDLIDELVGKKKVKASSS